jgi:lipopolysaccharide biosynthesis glycosyltransferase
MATAFRILMCGDDGYAPHVASALLSLRDHSGDTPVEVYLGVTSFTDEHRVRVQTVVPDLPITWIDIPRSWLDTLPESSWQVENFARLYVIEHLPQHFDRVLYLDADILVRDDLSELWSTDLNGATVGMVRDSSALWMQRLQWNLQELELDGNLAYMNSGLMLIDLNAWRTRSVFNRCMSYIETWADRMTYADQEIINAELCHEWTELAPRWNWIPQGFDQDEALQACAFTRAELHEARTNPAIVHFAGTKPWHWFDSRRELIGAATLAEWEANAHRTPYRDWYAAERERQLAERAARPSQRRSVLRRFKKATSVLLHG